MKKFVSLLLAFSLALCLAACGGSASSAVSGSAASSEAASSEAASSEAAQELSTTDALRIAGLKVAFFLLAPHTECFGRRNVFEYLKMYL